MGSGKNFIKKTLRKIRKALFWFFSILILVFLVLFLLLLIPGIQNILTSKAEKYLTEKLQTKIEIGAVRLSVPKAVLLKDVYVEDLSKDTLWYSNVIRADVNMLGLLRKKVHVNTLELKDVTGNVYRDDTLQGFNFDFIITAFASEKDTAIKVEKETAGNTWKIDVEQILLGDIKLSFRDEPIGINTGLKIGKFFTQFKNVDLKTISFDIEEILLKDVHAFFTDQNFGQHFNLDVGESRLLKHKVNISDQVLDLGTIKFSNTDIVIFQEENMPLDSQPNLNTHTVDNKETTIISSQASFEILPGWKIDLDELVFKENSFRMDNMNRAELSGTMDFNHLYLKDIRTKIQDIRLDRMIDGLTIVDLALNEKCGLVVNKLQTTVETDSVKTLIEKFHLETDNSDINLDVNAAYPSIQAFIDDIKNLSFDIKINESRVDWRDVYYFIPGRIEILRSPDDMGSIDLELSAEGSIQDLKVNSLELSAQQNTQIRLKGFAKNILDFDHFNGSIKLDTLVTSEDDLNNLFDISLLGGLELPPMIFLKADVVGNLNEMVAALDLQTSYGGVRITGDMSQKDGSLQDIFAAYIDIEEVDIGKILADSTIGPVTAAIGLTGSGLMNNDLNADYDVDIDKAVYNGYQYSDIALKGNYNGDSINTNLISTDPNLDLVLNLILVLEEDLTNVSVDLDIKNVSLMPLNFYPDDLSIKSKTTSSVTLLDSNQVSGNLLINDILISLDDIEYPVESLVAKADLLNNATTIHLDADILNADVSSNFNISTLPHLLEIRARDYIGLEDTSQIVKDHYLEFNIDVTNTDILTKVLVEDLDELVVDDLSGYWDGEKDYLYVNLDVPRVEYSDIEIDSIQLEVLADNEEIDYTLKIEHLLYDTVYLNNLLVKGDLRDGILYNRMVITDRLDSLKYSIPIQGKHRDGDYHISLLNEDLILNYKTWITNDQDYIRLDSSGNVKGNLSIGHEEQLLEFSAENDINSIYFEDFDLATLTSIINISDTVSIAGGIINGQVDLNSANDQSLITAGIKISDFQLLGKPLGILDINLATPNANHYQLGLSATNLDNSLLIDGDYFADSQDSPLDFDISLNFSNLTRIEEFVSSMLSDVGGGIFGDVAIKGSFDDLDYFGNLNFRETQFRVNTFHMLFTLPDEHIVLNDHKIILDQFTLLDNQNNRFLIDGAINLANDETPGLELNLHSDQFTLVSSTKEDNDLFFGNLTIGTDFEISGNMTNPVIDADISILNNTDLTYVLPGSKIEMITGEGIVEFIDEEALSDSLEQARESDYLTDSVLSKLPGVELSSRFTLNPQAKFTVVIDPLSGDYVTISGSANLIMTLDKSRNTMLSGRFEVTEGFYQVSFYNLVKKKFEITDGSAINWSGDPMDGLLNVTAEYIARTSSYALLSSMSGQMSDVEKALYNQRIPYHVKIMITGPMRNPEIGFGLDVPDRFKAELPTLATALNRLNQEDYESELNKQVFALLVTGAFIPGGGGSDGSSYNFATTAARNSLNAILAQQLNNISSQYIKGIDLNFGLTSVDSYESSSGTRTELDINVSKKLFNERVTVEAAGTFDLSGEKDKSENAQTYTTYGEFSIYYDLNKYQDFKAKVFSERAYDLFDGEIMNSGVGIIVQKDFNNMQELREERAVRKEERRKKKSEKREAKSE